MSDQPVKVDLETLNLTAAKRAAFEDLFPGVLADGVLDAGRLGELLDTEVAPVMDGRERFGLMWAGKKEAVQSLLTPSRGTLIPQLDRSVDFDTARNVFIEGDNLEVLKLLQKSYNDKVKLIYIDPPYNTGKDFVYSDDYNDALNTYLQYTGQIDDAGNRVAANTESSGRLHSRWLSMIYPRLVLARNLLRQDGVILVSIDDNEVASLRLLMDEVFGRENFIAELVWEKTRKNDATFFSVGHDYVIVFARNMSFLKLAPGTPWREEKPGAREIRDKYSELVAEHHNDAAEVQLGLRAWFRGLDQTHPSKKLARYKNVDNRGVWRDRDISWPGGGGPKYDLRHPATGGVCPMPKDGWRFKQDVMQEKIASGEVVFRQDHSTPPFCKAYLFDAADDSDTGGQVMPSVMYAQAQSASKHLQTLFNAKVFDNPKDHLVLARLFEYVAPGDDAIVLDFFAGSGSTAEAVAVVNQRREWHWKSILVNLPESTPADSIARRAGYSTIADITEARLGAVRRLFPKVMAQGLRVFSLGVSNFALLSPTEESLLALRETTLADSYSWESVAVEILMKEGVPLSARWHRSLIGGSQAVMAEQVAVVLSLAVDDLVTSAAFQLRSRVVVFVEDGFAGADAVKANAFTNAKNAGITMKTV